MLSARGVCRHIGRVSRLPSAWCLGRLPDQAEVADGPRQTVMKRALNLNSTGLFEPGRPQVRRSRRVVVVLRCCVDPQGGTMRAFDVQWRPIRRGRPASAGVLGALAIGLVSAAVSPAFAPAVWSAQAGPSPGTGGTFNGVSCVAAGSCQAVGYLGNATLIESWDGRAWSVVRSPDRGTTSTLNGVSCVSTWSCEAVGDYSTSTGLSQPLVESWNGTTWSVAPAPALAPNRSALNAVSCTARRSCVAVGNNGSDTLVESWSGTAWSVEPA